MQQSAKDISVAIRVSLVGLVVAVGQGLTLPISAQDSQPIKTPKDAKLRGLESLRLATQKDGGVPLPPDLNRYVRNRQAAIQLGKALFWDMQVGSDGIQSCATCHFNAGADNRAKNQMNPDILRFQNTRDGDVIGFFNAQSLPDTGFEFVRPNDTLAAADFPFVRNPRQWVTNPDGTVGPAFGNSNDMASSQGVFLTLFADVVPGSAVDLGVAQKDPVWNVNGVTVRRVEPNDSVLGPLAKPGTGLNPVIVNTYRDLIQKAFQPELWGGKKGVLMRNHRQVRLPGDASTVLTGATRFVELPPAGPLSEDTFEQIEANMAFFFGVSVMLYEATLVADETPFDKWMENGVLGRGFSEAELRGLNVFVGQGKCVNCHGGPELTNASVRNAENGRNLIEPMLMAQGAALYDNGFYNISVTLTTDDIGRGGKDPFGRPLTSSRQVLFERLGNQDIPFDIIGDPFPVTNENKEVTAGVDTNSNGLVDPGEEILIKRAAVDGAFKAPGLRNVELTGPYFHNGGWRH